MDHVTSNAIDRGRQAYASYRRDGNVSITHQKENYGDDKGWVYGEL